MIFRKHILIFFLSATSLAHANATCTDFQRIFGTLNLKTKTWKTLRVVETKETICEELPVPTNANLKVELIKDSKKFSTQIFRPLVRHWDEPAKNRKWTGGVVSIDETEINLLIPHWYKGSILTISDKNGKKLTEKKL